MPSYLITGVSRGIGLELLRQISSDTANTVIGFVRNKLATEAKISEWKRSNIHILQADLDDYDALKKAVDETAKITGGRLDYIIANAALVSLFGAFSSIDELGQDPKGFEEDLHKSFHTNVVANIHLFNLLMPLVLRGETKKVIAITSGYGDLDVTAKYELEYAAPYTISKAALNLAVAKFHSRYAKDGVLFMGISPGVVDTNIAELTEKQQQRQMQEFLRFKEYAPHFERLLTPEESVNAVLSVIEKGSLANGDGGAFVSHWGNKQWI